MIQGKKITVVFPAYNAARTLEMTFRALERGVVDDVILVDDASMDQTVDVAQRLGIHTIRHEKNMGYGANQKSCYREALQRGADIVIMVHPDYQYAPELVPAMGWLIACGVFDVVLTAWQNLLLNNKLSEYHTGYRAFSRSVLDKLPLEENSNDFVFDNQMLAQIIYFGFRIGEVTCPTRYFTEASSISFRRGVIYGLGVLRTSVQFRLSKSGLHRCRLFSSEGHGLSKNPLQDGVES
jgi:glycosyltransferase involved in cell wall biosynthesis